jgi:hypothetical protein
MTGTRAWVMIAAAFTLGVLAGGGINEVYHRSADATDRRLFGAKLRCQHLSEKYSTDNSISAMGSGLAEVTTTILKVDYSSASHSCIALTETRHSGFIDYSVIDIVTQEIYELRSCKQGDDCDRPASDILKTTNETFSRAVAGTIKSLGR